jgi:hypothetical protein
MTTSVVRLGDPTTPFTFSRGEKVAKLRDDGTPDPQFRGQIRDGTCAVESAGDPYTYEVQMDNGAYFTAAERELIKLSEAQEP